MSPKNVDIKEAVQLFFKNYTKFDGRSTRSEFWWAFLAYYIASIVIGGIAGATGLLILTSLYSLATIIPMIALEIRRMHVIGKCGWYILIPIYNLYLFAQPSDPNPNQYGEPASV
jgi:uncharacterized membrane protein YhaH (DUF805 family)